MEAFVQDLRFALRVLRKSPAFTAVAVLSVGLGIGATAAIFRLADAVLLRPWPVSEPSRLVEFHLTARSGTGEEPLSFPAFADYRAAGVLAGLAAFAPVELSLATSDRAALVSGELVSPNYFAVLGLRPAAGRFFVADGEAEPGVVLGWDSWRRLFGGDPAAVGRGVKLNGKLFTVVGVAPRGFKGIDLANPADLWLPLSTQPQVATGVLALLDLLHDREVRWLEGVGRLPKGVGIDAAQGGLAVAGRQMAAAFPRSDAGLQPVLVPATEAATGLDGRSEVSGFLGLLLAVACLELAIACANVAGLLVARGTARQREASVRMAVGATRGRFVRQLVTEGLVLSFAGLLVGVVVAWLAIDLLRVFELPADISIDTLTLGLDGRLIGFAVALTLAVGVAFSLPPALQVSATDLTGSLKDLPSESPRGRQRWLRKGLVVFQVGLTVLLIAGAGLFIQSVRHGLAADPGFNPDRVLKMAVDLGLQGYDAARAKNFYDELAVRVAALPGVESAAWSRAVPLSGGGIRTSVYVDGYAPPLGEDLQVGLDVVGPSYFETLRIPLLRGRSFTQADREGTAHAVIVNEAMARKFWPGSDPVGQRLSTGGAQGPFFEVVGVVPDGKVHRLDEEHQPYFYVPLDQYFAVVGLSRMNLLVRTTGDPEAAIGPVRAEVRRLDDSLPVSDVASLRDHVAGVLKTQRLGATLLGFFGLVSVALSFAGIYGVLAHHVGQRRRELALRMALGARRGEVLAMVLGRSLALVVPGLVAGLAAALASRRLVAGFLYGISPSDPVILAGSVALLAVAALTASLVPAWRASRLAPSFVLRSQ